MKLKKYLLLSILFSISTFTISAQKILNGQIIDQQSKEPIEGVSLMACHCDAMGECLCSGAITDSMGRFHLSCQNMDSLSISMVNYENLHIILTKNKFSGNCLFELKRLSDELDQIVVTGNRFKQNKKDISASIHVISQQTIQRTNATQLDQLVNKTPGVFMVDLGNEQHEMSIRQPMTTKSLFLYLEDGIPIRSSGLYNHNALLEMNMAAIQRIEILKGPASAQYGAEAIGGAVNIITRMPPLTQGGELSVQADNNGYRRTDLDYGGTIGKFGAVVSGYYASRNNGPIAYSDFHKTALTLNTIYNFKNDLNWVNSATYTDYYSDMTGSLDSTKFAKRDFSTDYTFTYRKVKALRVKSQLEKIWSKSADSKLSFLYRDNQVGQNPAYRIKDIKNSPNSATGEINLNSFKSFGFLLQHQQAFTWLNSKLTVGVTTEITPSNYLANFINIQKNPQGEYISYTNPDSLLTKYRTGINNYAGFGQFDISPIKNLKLTIATRFDKFRYVFTNSLPISAASGSPSSIQDFQRFTPKLGAVYNFKNIGFYGNYSQGFVPPQVTDLFNNVKTPFLKPQVFINYELGGWVNIIGQKLTAEWSLYQLNGTNEIISVRNDDGSTENQNAGKTRHKGVEYGLNYQINKSWQLRISGTEAKHQFIQEIQNGIRVSGNEMSDAPHHIINSELWFTPEKLTGLKLGIEWQNMGSYYMDDINTTKYHGFNIFNVRGNYSLGKWTLWANALNVLNSYYADIATKSGYGYSYNLGNPFTISIGVKYHIGH